MWVLKLPTYNLKNLSNVKTLLIAGKTFVIRWMLSIKNNFIFLWIKNNIKFLNKYIFFFNNLNNNNQNISVLPVELNSILIGTMLGDGGLYRSSPTANVRFEMSLGEKYKDFAFHMAGLFKEFWIIQLNL